MTEYHDHVSCSREMITSPPSGFMAWIDSSVHDLSAARHPEDSSVVAVALVEADRASRAVAGVFGVDRQQRG